MEKHQKTCSINKIMNGGHKNKNQTNERKNLKKAKKHKEQ